MPARDFDVFARSEQGEPLHQVGSVSAATTDDAIVFARALYDERAWREMFVVARDDLIRLIAPR